MKNTMKENPTQTTQILLYMKEGNKINPLQALKKFGCFRLGARIWEIREMKFKVKTNFVKTNNGAVIAEYELLQGYKQGNLFD